MPKLRPSLSLANGPEVHLMDVRFPYECFALREELKQLAGVRWEPKRKAWEVSRDLIKAVCSLALQYELSVIDNLTHELRPAPKHLDLVNPLLYKYQQDAVVQALNIKALMLNFETGLGKTPAAIEVLRLSRVRRTLVVCPAMVRLVWADELKKWWPILPAKSVGVIEQGADIALGQDYLKANPTETAIVIVSYNMLTNANFDPTGWEAIIFDESHYLKEPESGRSQAALALVRNNPEAIKLLLTATPITSEPKDLWHQLHIMYPGRFGTKWQFYKRYAHTEENQYGGLEVWGVRDELVPELKARLEDITIRVTKKEVAHLLPPYDVQMVRVNSNDKIKVKELITEFQGTDMHRQVLDNFLTKAGPLKIPIAADHVRESLAGGSTHMMVLTHFKESAKAIYQELLGLKDTMVVHYDGANTASERAKLTKEAANAKRAVIVCTMHSVKEGIDLTKFTDSIAAELYWQPATIIQLLGRYHRLSSKVAARFRFLVLAGSLDEIIAKVLKRRITDMSKIIDSGVSEEKFQEAFVGKQKNESELLDELRLVARRRTAFDEYT